MGKIIDMTGWKMWEHGVPNSKLTVVTINEELSRIKKKAMWECKCSCGSKKIIVGAGGDIRNGKLRSCGCLKAKTNINHCGTHGESGTRLYRIWCGMRQRCNNPNHKNYDIYGGRGIRVCDDWNDYEIFRNWAMSNGYSDKLTIDRIDVNGNYEPNNCRWVDFVVQSNNRSNNHIVKYGDEFITVAELAKMTNNKYNTVSTRINHLNYSVEDCVNIEVGKSEKGKRYIEFNGKRQTVTDWARELNMSPETLFSRLNDSKWSIEKALTEPIDKSKKRN